MKILVTGGRAYVDRQTLFDTLDGIHALYHVSCVVHGRAAGADRLAGRWADSRNIRQVGYPAQWKTQGPMAGPIRNEKMYIREKPELVVAFPGGPGTADCKARAAKHGVQLIEISA